MQMKQPAVSRREKPLRRRVEPLRRRWKRFAVGLWLWRRGAGQSAARVPIWAARTRTPPAASGIGSRLPQSSPDSMSARVLFAGATSVAARTTSGERRRGSFELASPLQRAPCRWAFRCRLRALTRAQPRPLHEDRTLQSSLLAVDIALTPVYSCSSCSQVVAGTST